MLVLFNITQLTGHWIIAVYLWEEIQSFSKKEIFSKSHRLKLRKFSLLVSEK